MVQLDWSPASLDLVCTGGRSVWKAGVPSVSPLGDSQEIQGGHWRAPFNGKQRGPLAATGRDWDLVFVFREIEPQSLMATKAGKSGWEREKGF